jgi:hypothetical protein
MHPLRNVTDPVARYAALQRGGVAMLKTNFREIKPGACPIDPRCVKGYKHAGFCGYVIIVTKETDNAK